MLVFFEMVMHHWHGSLKATTRKSDENVQSGEAVVLTPGSPGCFQKRNVATFWCTTTSLSPT